MTRVTNFGRKRTYVEAGLAKDAEIPKEISPQVAEAKVAEDVNSATPQTIENQADAPPPKKKRKRTKPSKRDGNAAKTAAAVSAESSAPEGTAESNPEVAKPSGSVEDTVASKASKKKKRKEKEMARKKRILTATEQRRLKRIQEKNSATTCFACREKGHAARDCPVTQGAADIDNGKGKSVIGICYRCGSTKHTLSRCKKSVDSENPMPFASCFVCSGKGHLASACPQNKAKGIYPDGGCCKLCGDNSHLARDCGLRKKDVISTSEVLGTGEEAGADEDDFHIFKRRTTEIERTERHEDKLKRSMEVKAGVHTGIVKAFGKVPAVEKTKKIVMFY